MKVALLVCLLIFSSLHATSKTDVLFINPGGEGDPFFQKMTDLMYFVAYDLNMELEVIYCDRNHITLETELLRAIERDIKPEYLLLINEKDAIAPFLSQVNDAQIYFYLFNEGVLPENSNENPIDTMEYCLAELLPDDYNAGELLADALYSAHSFNHGTVTKTDVIGLAGVTATTSSITREQGFFDYFESISTADIKQVVPAYHDRDKANFVTSGLIERYGSVDIIWAASDIMALGSREVFTADNCPIIGGVDWSDEAIESIVNGELAVSVGGHFLDGARVLLSIAKLEKYGKGDAIHEEYRSSFAAITKDNLHIYSPFFDGKEKWDLVDFSQFVFPTIIPEYITADQFLDAYKKAN